MSQYVLFLILISLHSTLCENDIQSRGHRVESEVTHTPQFLMGINRLQFVHPDIDNIKNSRDTVEEDNNVLFDNNRELDNKLSSSFKERDTDENIIDNTLKDEKNNVEIGRNEITDAKEEIPKVFGPKLINGDKNEQSGIKFLNERADLNEEEYYVNLDIRVDEADKALVDKVNIHFSYEDTDD